MTDRSRRTSSDGQVVLSPCVPRGQRGHRRLLDLRRNTTLGQPDAHIDKAANVLLRTSQGTFPVVDGNGSYVGILSLNVRRPQP
jgi:hypothetical protein